MAQFKDPYENCPTFNPIFRKLFSLGFTLSACIQYEDDLYKIFTYADGSNVLMVKVGNLGMWPLVLYDSVEAILYINPYYAFKGEHDIREWAKGTFGDLLNDVTVVFIKLKELERITETKEFCDVFRRKASTTDGHGNP